jgi:hypothetical protein
VSISEGGSEAGAVSASVESEVEPVVAESDFDSGGAFEAAPSAPEASGAESSSMGGCFSSC